MDKHYSFRDGLPTKPDVDLILKTWPNLSIGDRISYEEMETCLGIKWKSARFDSVTDRWRRRMVDEGFIIDREKGIGFYVLPPKNIQENTYGLLKHVGKSARKQRRAVLTIRTHEGVDDVTMARTDHHARLLSEIERSVTESKKTILPSLRKEAVMIAPPEQKKS